MSSGTNDGAIPGEGSATIGYVLLARELQSSLYLIARHAELQAPDSVRQISRIAEASLALIDSYILAAQVERGQLRLDIEPISVGSVLQDAKYELMRLLPDSQPIEVMIDRDKPVVTHPPSLRAMMVACGLALSEAAQVLSMPIVFKGYKTRSGSSGVGVFVEGMNLGKNDLFKALSADNDSRLVLPKHQSGSGVALSIADTLCSTIGGNLQVKRFGRLSGLSTVLPKSDQLALV